MLNLRKRYNLKTFFATKVWYLATLAVVIPATMQQVISASMDLSDNFFVSNISSYWIKNSLFIKDSLVDINYDLLFQYKSPGDIAMAGVAASNQMFYIMFSIMMGISYGAGIFGTQYYGAGRYDKLKQTVNFRLIIAIAMGLFLFILAWTPIGYSLIEFTTNPQALKQKFESDPNNLLTKIDYWTGIAATDQGITYLRIISTSYILLGVNSVLLTALRETKRVSLPLYLSIMSLVLNCILNLLLTTPVVGDWQALGVVGAAIATIASRIIQFTILIIMMFWKKYEFNPHLSTFFKFDFDLIKKIIIKSWPILLNEFLLALAIVIQVKYKSQYSVDGLTATAISATFTTLFATIFQGFSASVAILVGNRLGDNDLNGGRYNAHHLLTMGIFFGSIFSILMIISGYFLPSLLFPQSTQTVLEMARWMTIIYAMFFLPMMITFICYYIIRAGGQTTTSLFLDSIFTWILPVPILITLIYLKPFNTGSVILDFSLIILIVQSTDFVKMIISLISYKQKKWVRNLAETLSSESKLETNDKIITIDPTVTKDISKVPVSIEET